jgi:hypothetical protein
MATVCTLGVPPGAGRSSPPEFSVNGENGAISESRYRGMLLVIFM